MEVNAKYPHGYKNQQVYVYLCWNQARCDFDFRPKLKQTMLRDKLIDMTTGYIQNGMLPRDLNCFQILDRIEDTNPKCRIRL